MVTATETTTEARMNTVEAARFLGFAANTLAVWRMQRLGPAYLKVGKKVFYFKSDLEAWQERQRVEPQLVGE